MLRGSVLLRVSWMGMFQRTAPLQCAPTANLRIEQAEKTGAANTQTQGFYDSMFVESPNQSIPRVQPPEMRITLLPFQQEGVAWMLNRERSHRGGIMADHLGMGKTVQMLGLCLANAPRSRFNTEKSQAIENDIAENTPSSPTSLNTKPVGHRLMTVIKQFLKVPALGNLSKLNRPGMDLFCLSGAIEAKLQHFDSTYDAEIEELEKWIAFAEGNNPAFANNARAFIRDDVAVDGDDLMKMNTPELRTLIVLPASLILQWKSEIANKINPDFKPSVFVYHGSNKTRDVSAMQLESYDFVLTSYETLVSAADGCDSTHIKTKARRRSKVNLASEDEPESMVSFDYSKAGPLYQANWKRIILDEAHNVRGNTTRRWSCIRRLNGTKKWAVTATPLHNSIEDIQTLLEFTQTPRLPIWKRGNGSTDQVLRDPVLQSTISRALSTVFLRRSPVMKRNGQTETLVALPPKKEKIILCKLNAAERKIYNEIISMSHSSLRVGERGGYARAFTMMIRLRQVCAHHWLLKPGTKQGSYLCGICKEQASEPVITKCGHSFCRECLQAKFEETATCQNNEMEEESEAGLKHKGWGQSEQQSLAVRISCPECNAVLPKSLLEKDSNSSRKVRVDKLLNRKWESSSKVDLVVKLVRKVLGTPATQNDKIVIFSQFTTFLDVIEVALRRATVDYLRVDGDTSLIDRDQTIGLFGRDTIPVLLASKMATGVGLNLTMANHVIVVDPWWNPAIEEQAVHRCHRIGQTKTVKVTRIVVDSSVEQYCLEVCRRKKDFGEAVLAAATTGDKADKALGMSRFQELLGKLHTLSPIEQEKPGILDESPASQTSSPEQKSSPQTKGQVLNLKRQVASDSPLVDGARFPLQPVTPKLRPGPRCLSDDAEVSEF